MKDEIHRRLLHATNHGSRYLGIHRWVDRNWGIFQSLSTLRLDIRQQSSVAGSGVSKKELIASPIVTTVSEFSRQSMTVISTTFAMLQPITM
jgi:hypothetical protein